MHSPIQFLYAEHADRIYQDCIDCSPLQFVRRREFLRVEKGANRNIQRVLHILRVELREHDLAI